MVKITSRTPTSQDVIDLANQMRQCDLDELEAVTDLTPLEAVQFSVANSDNRFLLAFFKDESLLCIAGCSRTGNPWLLGTDSMNRHGYSLTKTAKKAARAMLLSWPRLSNFVDARNKKTIQWLQALGFTLTDTLELKAGFPVIQFEMSRYE